MTNLLRSLSGRLFPRRAASVARGATDAALIHIENQPGPVGDDVNYFDGPVGHLGPFDGSIVERARTQWQFGDWQSLAQLNRDTLQHHPDRAKLALLAAAGRLQTDQIEHLAR